MLIVIISILISIFKMVGVVIKVIFVNVLAYIGATMAIILSKRAFTRTRKAMSSLPNMLPSDD